MKKLGFSFFSVVFLAGVAFDFGVAFALAVTFALGSGFALGTFFLKRGVLPRVLTFFSFTGASLAFLVPTLKAPNPPVENVDTPLMPPIPAAFACLESSVGPVVMGMIMGAKADTCATSRTAARMHLVKVEENILVVLFFQFLYSLVLIKAHHCSSVAAYVSSSHQNPNLSLHDPPKCICQTLRVHPT